MIFTMIPILFLVYVVIERIKRKREKEIVREREKETETRKGNVSTTGERNVKERKAGDKKKDAKDGKMGKSNAEFFFF